MKPTIALVGRPNTGKSTLYNQLTRTRDALVADLAGLTRDRQYGDGKRGGWPYLLVDTGGLSGTPNSLDAAMADQTLQAVQEADLVIFLVDGRAGLLAVDVEIAEILRRQARKVILCVNKIDGVGEEKAQLDFHQLGFDTMVPIAAAHNRGIQALVTAMADHFDIPKDQRVELTGRRGSRQRSSASRGLDGATDANDALLAGRTTAPAGDTEASPGSELPAVSAPDAAEVAEARDVRIAFIGRPNVGKSTLINRLLGETRVIAYDQPGTTRDSVAIPIERAGRDYILIDTAGVRRRGKVSDKVEIFSIIKTLQAVDNSNVCVLLIDANDGITEQDLSLLGHVIDKGRALVVAVNKWDSLTPEQREALREDLQRRVEFLKFTRIHFISALNGSGVGDLFKSINKAYASAFIKLSTPKLTRMLDVFTTQHQPPMVNGRRIRLRYAHQGGLNPPIIVVHGKQASKVPKSYQRYLINHFAKALHLFGTPLRVEFRQDDNPYQESGRVKSRREMQVGDKKDSRQRGGDASARKSRVNATRTRSGKSESENPSPSSIKRGERSRSQRVGRGRRSN